MKHLLESQVWMELLADVCYYIAGLPITSGIHHPQQSAQL